jgi:hypothetical protein
MTTHPLSGTIYTNFSIDQNLVRAVVVFQTLTCTCWGLPRLFLLEFFPGRAWLIMLRFFPERAEVSASYNKGFYSGMGHNMRM